jgi:hypothetical protein
VGGWPVPVSRTGVHADLDTSHASFSFCKIFLRWLTLRKKKNSLIEKLRVSLLEKSNWLAGCCGSSVPNAQRLWIPTKTGEVFKG